MANEIKFVYATGETLTYGAYQPDGTVRTAAGTSLTEVAGTGYYKATDASVVVGDTVVVKDAASNIIGGGRYDKPPTEALTDINLHKLMKTAIAGPNLTTSDVASDSVLAHIISSAAGTDVTLFRNTTDSLQAIKDAQQAACQAALETNNLDHLMKVACPAGAVVSTSAIGYLADTNGVWADFLSGSYSLKDIKNGQATALSDINLHKLMYYACASGDVKNNSALAQIASKTQHWSTFNYSTDSLEAIRDTASTGSGVPEITD